MKFTLVALICAPLFTACSTFQPQQATWPWKELKVVCAADDCTPAEAMARFHEATMFCRAVHNYYESGGVASSKASLAIGAFGTFAGAVAAPLAGGSASTAWSSLSGATNAMQASIKDNFSPTVSVNRMTEVRNSTEIGISEYSTANDENARVLVAIKMATMCAMAPGEADRNALRALLQ